MSFLRGVGNISVKEGLVFDYWLTVLSLLKMGISYADIHSFTDNEVAFIFGVEGATQQKEFEDRERAERMAEQRSRAQNNAGF